MEGENELQKVPSDLYKYDKHMHTDTQNNKNNRNNKQRISFKNEFTRYPEILH